MKTETAAYIADLARVLVTMADRAGLTDLARLLRMVELQAMQDAQK